jgi:hypothetical protein
LHYIGESRDKGGYHMKCRKKVGIYSQRLYEREITIDPQKINTKIKKTDERNY